MTLLVSRTSYIVVSLHSHNSHTFTITTLSFYTILLGNSRNPLSSLSLHFASLILYTIHTSHNILHIYLKQKKIHTSQEWTTSGGIPLNRKHLRLPLLKDKMATWIWSETRWQLRHFILSTPLNCVIETKQEKARSFKHYHYHSILT